MLLSYLTSCFRSLIISVRNYRNFLWRNGSLQHSVSISQVFSLYKLLVFMFQIKCNLVAGSNIVTISLPFLLSLVK